jgi:hypothetical protein
MSRVRDIPFSGKGPHVTAVGNNSLNTRSTLTAAGKTYAYYSLAKVAAPSPRT